MARAILWTRQRSSFGGRATETQQRVSYGGRGDGGGRVAPKRVTQFFGDAHGAASATAALWTVQRLSFGGWATQMRQGFSHRVGGPGMGGLCPAV